jgi:iron complex transport system permease protein
MDALVQRRRRVLLLLGLLLPIAALLALGLGPLTWQTFVADATLRRVVVEIRLPRVLLALLAGACFSLGGLAAQTLFRNPLASPYVIGISHGAATGAALALLAASPAAAWLLVPLTGTLAGLLVTALTLVLALRLAEAAGAGLILAGIAISAFFAALTAGLLYLAGEKLAALVFWLMGGLTHAGWHEPLTLLPITVLGLFWMQRLAPALNVWLTGERSAADLGVETTRLRLHLVALIGLLTSVTVSLCGVIGFVGLIVPHIFRRLLGADHRWLVPASAAGGALLLLVADTLVRTFAFRGELPVGVLTALLGGPFFLWLLLRRNNTAGTP